MIAPADVTRLRTESNDDRVMNYLYEQDAAFRQAVDNVRAKNPDMTPFEQYKMPSAMLDMHYGNKTPKPKNINPLTTQMANAASEKVAEAQKEREFSMSNPFGQLSMDSVGGGIVKGIVGASPYLQEVGDTMGKTIQGIGEGVRDAQQRFESGETNVFAAANQMIGSILGGGAKLAWDPITTGLKTPANLLVDSYKQNPGLIGPIIDSFKDHPGLLGPTAASIGSMFSGIADYFAKNDPESARQFKAVAQAVSFVPAVEGAYGVTKGIGGMVENLGKSIPGFRPRTPEQLKAAIDKVVGQITQTTDKKEIPKLAKALDDVNPFDDVTGEGTPTYKELSDAIGAKGSALNEKQSELLSSVPGTRKLDEFVKTSVSGAKTASTNPVENAFSHLEELYANTGRQDDLVRIQALRDAAVTEGLTVKQLNDFAIEYGQARSGFSAATGQPLTSVNAQMYENTRKGVKEMVRNTLPDDTSRLIDSQISRNIDLRNAIADVEEKVMNLQNKINERGLGEKIGRMIGKTTDAATGHSLRGFTSALFPSNVGLKQMNSLEIQAALSKNLKTLDKLLREVNTLPDDEAVNAVFGALKPNLKAASIPGAGNGVNALPSDQINGIQLPGPQIQPAEVTAGLLNEAKKFKTVDQFLQSFDKKPFELPVGITPAELFRLSRVKK